MDSTTSTEITKARAAMDTDRATELEQQAEAELARSGDEEAIARAGHDPADLAKAHKGKRSRASVPSSTKAKLSGDLSRDELEARAAAAGINNPDDREAYPNKGALIDAINGKEG